MDYSSAIICDTETYKNYCLVMFKKVISKDVIYFEKFNDSDINRDNICYILNKYDIVTFNGDKYDSVILALLLRGLSNEAIKAGSDMLIVDRKQPWQVLKQMGAGKIYYESIDLIQVAPLSASLKMYMGRMHAPKMQDLPIKPDAIIKESDLPEMRLYCENDNDGPILLLNTLEKQLDLRLHMSEEYKVDLRSKSDAQIAEAVIKHELGEHYGIKAKRPKIEAGTQFYYKPPSSLIFETKLFKEIYNEYCSIPIVVQSSGHVKQDSLLFEEKFMYNDLKYKIGIGGMHSVEKKISHYANENKLLVDIDVAAFYPNIILNNELYPKHLGRPFLDVYRSIVERRLKAKDDGDKEVDASLKITINGLFGKFGNKWSIVYSPDLMAQVTITGQLSLLMLIERLTLAGFKILSANTDGIVVSLRPNQKTLMKEIVEQWEFDTSYDMEYTYYKSVHSRDVNNYIAIGAEGDYVKSIGVYCDPHSPKNMLKKNPVNEICAIATKEFLQNSIPVRDTIEYCDDITKFLTVRTVNNGGATYDGKLVGKAVRWYYGKNELDSMYVADNGNKVPRSDGAKPIMQLPDKFPNDVDIEWYVTEAEKMLKEVGYKNAQ